LKQSQVDLNNTLNINMLKFTIISLLLFTTVTNNIAQTITFVAYDQAVNGKNIIIKMVPIPAGTFTMGSPNTEKGRQTDEGPQVIVKVEPFWMAETEITHDQFMAFRFEEKDLNPKPDAITRPTAQYIDLTWGMGKEGGFPANSMQPFTAITYCKWLWKKTGVFYRLPSEAEWEYAAKAGKNTIYQEGVTIQNLAKYAWYNINSKEKYNVVGKKLPNKWGLYDMMGNVAEWTMDRYDAQYFDFLKQNAISTNIIKRQNFKSYHTAKGGGFKSTLAELRTSDRMPQTESWNKRDPQIPRSKWWLTDGDYIGFRIVRPLVQPSNDEIELFFKEALDEQR
jgi:formylglycine-generating enzyme required for sulfatase activity